MSSVGPGVPKFSDVCRGLLASGLAIRFQATGESMSPTIRDGEMVEIAPIGDAGKLCCGDIVLYESAGGRLVCHRLVSLAGFPPDRRLVLRGDAGWAGEESALAGQVLGVASALVRNGARRSLRGRPARLRDAGRRFAGVLRGSILRSIRRPAS